MEEKKAALEAALFIAEDSLDTDDIADVLNLGSKGYVQMVLDELQEEMAEEDRGLELIEVDGGYRMQVKQDYIDEVKHLAPHQDLGDAELRTLSLIAYNAPVKQKKIIDIRGNRAYKQIKELESRGFLESAKEGRTKVLDVTDDFLDYFGMDSIEEFRRQSEAQPASELMEDESEERENAEEQRENKDEEQNRPAEEDNELISPSEDGTRDEDEDSEEGEREQG